MMGAPAAGGGGSHGSWALVKLALWALVAVPWIAATVLSPWSMVRVMWRAAADPPRSGYVLRQWIDSWLLGGQVFAIPFLPPPGAPLPPAAQALVGRASVSKHGWTLTVRTDHARYVVGQPVTLTVTLTNHTPASAPVPTLGDAPLDVTVLDPAEQPLPDVSGISWQPVASDTAWATCPVGTFDYCVAPGGSITRRVTVTPWSADYPDHEAGRWLVITGIGLSRTQVAFEVTAPPAGGMPATAPGR